ncbi:MAG: hypothetical protein IKU77_05850 [Alistipes sp.]|nr:hypothetical protein [Alistipes sp.]
MRLMAGDGYDWGKLILGIFRVVASGAIAYLIYYLNRRGNISAWKQCKNFGWYGIYLAR